MEMVTAVLFDFNRQDCKLGPLLSLLAQVEPPDHGRHGFSSDLRCSDLMGS
jgi:hypothetical protein